MRRRKTRLCYFLSLLQILTLSSLSCTLAQSRKPLTSNDLIRLATVGDAQISPNGQWVVHVVSAVDGDKNASTLYLSRIASSLNPPSDRKSDTDLRVEWPDTLGGSTPLLGSDWNAISPRWSPDSSSIAFLAKHDGLDGLWQVKLDRREPRLLANIQSTNFFITYAGNSFSWSPDSKRIAYISATPDSENTSTSKPDDPRVIDRIQYKSRTALSDNLRTHVFLVDIERQSTSQLTSGSYYDHAVAFSPRGDEIAFLSNHETDPDALNNSDIFVVDLRSSVHQLTQTKGCEYEPTWSPDGKLLAYVATSRDVTTIDSVAEDTHLWVISASGGGGREVATDQDRRVRDPAWGPDGRSIYYLAGDHGYTTIFRVGVDGGTPSRFTVFSLNGQLAGTFDFSEARARLDNRSQGNSIVPFQISNFSLANRTQYAGLGSGVADSVPFVFSMGTALRPAEVWFCLRGNDQLFRLSSHNDGLVRSLRLTVPEEINYTSFDGASIQGWLMRPAGCRTDRKCPLILSIHGGPHGMFGWSFNASFQFYVARGYGVLYINPRGSSGYGQKFSDGTLNEWGGGDYKDLLAGVDEVTRKNLWIDSSRLGVTGRSYGGFMTNWIITQTTRFNAAVSVASVSNLISFYSTSLYQDLVHAEFGGQPWDNYDLLWQWSPLRYVRQAQTPTLFIHGENDNDVHITQAEEMYMALKRRGVDSQFVRYPREGHAFREPKHRVDELERTIAWFDKYLK